MTDSPSLLLQRAAERLLELSSDPTGLPQAWWWVDWRYPSCGELQEWQVCGRGKPLFTATEHATTDDAEWVAVMSPAVAGPLVAWLRDTAADLEVGPVQTSTEEAALEFARLILGEAPGE